MIVRIQSDSFKQAVLNEDMIKGYGPARYFPLSLKGGPSKTFDYIAFWLTGYKYIQYYAKVKEHREFPRIALSFWLKTKGARLKNDLHLKEIKDVAILGKLEKLDRPTLCSSKNPRCSFTYCKMSDLLSGEI